MAELVEAGPLAQGGDEEGYGSTAQASSKLARRETLNLYHQMSAPLDLKQVSVAHLMDYDPQALADFAAFDVFSSTVWVNPRLWRMMAKLVGLSCAVGAMVFLFAFDPVNLRVREFRLIGTYLNVFVAFLLGLFMSIALNRWLNCVNGFIKAFECVRGLQVQLYSLGVDEAKVTHVLRYGMAACRIVVSRLHDARLASAETEEAKDQMWHDLQNVGEDISVLLPEEVEVLRDMEDPASLLWIWVGSLLGRMAQDGQIPAMQSPTFCRFVQLCQDAQDSLRLVEHQVNVQTPFIYVHTLSIVVHFNNILAAVTFGLTLGASAGVVLVSLGYHWSGVIHQHHEPEVKPLAKVLENILIAFITCFVGPLLFQAFLLIGFSISAPFRHDDAQIPTDMFLNRLQSVLLEGNKVAAKLPGWEAPRFGS